MLQVESALFDNHISSAFLLVSGAWIKDKKLIRAAEATERFDKEGERLHIVPLIYRRGCKQCRLQNAKKIKLALQMFSEEEMQSSRMSDLK